MVSVQEWLISLPLARFRQIQKAYRILIRAGVSYAEAIDTLYHADMRRQQFANANNVQ